MHYHSRQTREFARLITNHQKTLMLTLMHIINPATKAIIINNALSLKTNTGICATHYESPKNFNADSNAYN
ncbi:MAG: hypothetical protein IJT21_10630 [Synergistaceae bacterium]|nr:hypothetical protein [Synergistaceae bacterium]